jgi:hypothetical protein
MTLDRLGNRRSILLSYGRTGLFVSQPMRYKIVMTFGPILPVLAILIRSCLISLFATILRRFCGGTRLETSPCFLANAPRVRVRIPLSGHTYTSCISCHTAAIGTGQPTRRQHTGRGGARQASWRNGPARPCVFCLAAQLLLLVQASATGVVEALVADDAAGEAREDRGEGGPECPLHRLPGGGGRSAAGVVQGDTEAAPMSLTGSYLTCSLGFRVETERYAFAGRHAISPGATSAGERQVGSSGKGAQTVFTRSPPGEKSIDTRRP